MNHREEDRLDDWLDSEDYWRGEFRLLTEWIEDSWILVLKDHKAAISFPLCDAHTRENEIRCEECSITRFSSRINSCYNTPFRLFDKISPMKSKVLGEINFLLKTRQLVLREIPEERRSEEMKKVAREKTEETLECDDCYETWSAEGVWIGLSFILLDDDDGLCPECDSEDYSILHA